MTSSPKPPSELRAKLEDELVRDWHAHRSSAALQKLISFYMPRLRAMARRANASHAEDLTAEAVIALIHAAEAWNPEDGRSFAARAIPRIRGAILVARAELSTLVSIPERQIRDAFAGRSSAAQAELVQSAMEIEGFDEFESALNTPAAEEETLQRERQRQLRNAVAGALRLLSPQERQLIVHHLLHEDVALETLAARLKLSTERARQLEGRALHKMRNTLMNDGFQLKGLT